MGLVVHAGAQESGLRVVVVRLALRTCKPVHCGPLCFLNTRRIYKFRAYELKDMHSYFGAGLAALYAKPWPPIK